MLVIPTNLPKPETNDEAGILSLILIQLSKLTEILEKHTGEMADDALDGE